MLSVHYLDDESHMDINVRYNNDNSYFYKEYDNISNIELSGELLALQLNNIEGIVYTYKIDVYIRPSTISLKITMELGTELTTITDMDIENILRTLATLDSIGIVHGDIKKENIIVCNNIPKLIDFGIMTNIYEKHIVTQTYGSRKGYLHLNNKLSHRSAIKESLFATGILLYRLLVDDSTIDTSIIMSDNDIYSTPYYVPSYTVNIDSIIEKIPERWKSVVSDLLYGKYTRFTEIYSVDSKDPISITVPDKWEINDKDILALCQEYYDEVDLLSNPYFFFTKFIVMIYVLSGKNESLDVIKAGANLLLTTCDNNIHTKSAIESTMGLWNFYYINCTRRQATCAIARFVATGKFEIRDDEKQWSILSKDLLNLMDEIKDYYIPNYLFYITKKKIHLTKTNK